MKKIFTLVILIFSTLSASENEDFTQACESIDFYPQSNHFAVIHENIRRSRYVKIITDKNCGQCFIIKQTTNQKLSSELDPIDEAFCSELAQSINLPAQKVIIVPPHTWNQILYHQEFPASIHAIVPGKQVPETSYQKVCIKQRNKKNTPREEMGLTIGIINRMTRHPQLPKIVALDTFIGMNDRHNKNLFYDETTDLFWLIDMAGCFRHNLAELAYENLKMMSEKTEFSKKELKSLRIYRDTLQLLIDKYPPQVLHRLYDSYINQAKHQFKKEHITVRKIGIINSYFSGKKLVQFLDEHIL